MVTAIAKRINPSGAEEVTVRRVGTDRIEIIIPGADPDLVEQKKRLITKLGSLEFGIVANTKDHKDIIQRARELPETENDLRSGNKLEASWRDVDEKKADRSGEVGFREVSRTDPKTGDQIKVEQYLIMHESPERTVTGKY